MDIELCHQIKTEFQRTEHYHFSSLYVGITERTVRNFVRYDFGTQWLNIFILGCKVEGGDSYSMNVFVFKFVRETVQKFVKQTNSKVIGSIAALECRCDFDEPVEHFGSVLIRDVVLRHRVFSRRFFLEELDLKESHYFLHLVMVNL